jgi:hypothetical protein
VVHIGTVWNVSHLIKKNWQAYTARDAGRDSEEIYMEKYNAFGTLPSWHLNPLWRQTNLNSCNKAGEAAVKLTYPC